MASKAKVWYGDVPGRRCYECGQRVDWDERLRLGYFAQGGPTLQDGVTPLYDPARHYGNTPEGLAEQAKLQAHAREFHNGGLVETITQNGWRLEVHQYSAALAFGRECLKKGRSFYGVLSCQAPNGERVETILEACRTPQEVKAKSGIGKEA